LKNQSSFTGCIAGKRSYIYVFKSETQNGVFMDKLENEVIGVYLSGGISFKKYRSLSSPYVMVRSNRFTRDMDSSVLGTLVSLCRVSVRGICEIHDLYDLVSDDILISRSTFFRHLKQLKTIDAVKNFGDYLLVNPIYVSIGRKHEVSRLHEIYNGINLDDKTIGAIRPKVRRDNGNEKLLKMYDAVSGDSRIKHMNGTKKKEVINANARELLSLKNSLKSAMDNNDYEKMVEVGDKLKAIVVA